MLDRLKWATLAVVLVAISGGSAFAQLLAYDPFKASWYGQPANPANGEYSQGQNGDPLPPPNDGLGGQNPVIGPTAFYAGAWLQHLQNEKNVVRGPSLTYPNFPHLGSTVKEDWVFNCCTFGRSARPIGDVTGSGENGIGVGRDDHLFYQSFLIDFGDNGGNPDQGYTAYESWNGFDPNNPDASRVLEIFVNGWGGVGNLSLHIATPGHDEQQVLGTGFTLDDLQAVNNGTHLLVLKYDMKGSDPDVVSVYLDPTDSIESNWTPAASISIPTSDLVFDHHGAITQFQFPGDGIPTKGGAFDEVRWGRTFADVTPFGTPEPSSALLLILGAAGLMAGRRR